VYVPGTVLTPSRNAKIAAFLAQLMVTWLIMDRVSSSCNRWFNAGMALTLTAVSILVTAARP